MKKFVFSLMAMMVAVLTVDAQTRVLSIADNTRNTFTIPYADITTATFSADSMFVETQYGTFALAIADVATFRGDMVDNALMVAINYDEDGVTVVNGLAHRGVTVAVDGGNVMIDNPIEDAEITVSVSGKHSNGSLLYNGNYKMTLVLNGVDLTSKSGAAVHIKCGKRIAVVLPDGTVNTLADMAEGEQKAALYFKGHPEFEGAGTLNVTGNSNHAISSKEYIQFKKTVGTVNILGAKNDGIHAGQYFQMNGGKLNISNVEGDGVQSEPTDDVTDEKNGQLIIKGGEIKISVAGATADCLKADSTITISGGTLDLKTTGNGIIDESAGNAPQLGPGGGGGGWPPGGGGGWPPGGGGSKTETSSPKCINGGWDIVITGGNITTLSTGKGGKGIVADGILTIGGEDMNPVISCTTSGSAVTGSGENLSGQPKAIKVEGDIVINSGDIFCKTSQSGGEGIESKSTITINGGTVVCNVYDDGLNAAKKITFNGGVVWSWATNNDGVDCNGNAGIEINGGIIVSNGARSPEEGFDCDNYTFAINGGTAFGVGGATSTVTKAKQPFASTTGVNVTQGKYLSMCDAQGNVLLSYLCPSTLSSATVVSTSPGYGHNTACKLVYGVTAVENPTASYCDGRILVGGALSGGTNKSITPKTK